MVPGMARIRGDGTHAADIGRGSTKTRWYRCERMLCRRDFRSRKKRGDKVGKTKRGKGTKIMAIADRAGLLLAVCTASASPAEVKLVQDTLDARAVKPRPERLIGDKAYDSDPLDRSLHAQGVEMIAPHRRNRRADRRTQDGRPLRRYKRRWKVERLFAWLGNFRRLVVRYERYHQNYTAFVQLACCLILMRYIILG